MAWWKGMFLDEGAAALRRAKPIVSNVLAHEESMKAISSEEFREKTASFKKRIAEGEDLEKIAPEAFALVREASRRTLGQRHFDVQLIGGLILHRAGIAEMRTGEGKTLVATLPAYLNALSGKGVHVVTVNDYLSRRDAVWMGQIYHALGLTVGVINHEKSFIYDPSFGERLEIQPKDSSLDDGSEADKKRDVTGGFHVIHEFLRPCTRREAYAADITYGTNNEFGFDYLRDNLEYNPESIRQREHHFAIVDEIDSILIDEARTPLIISAPVSSAESLYTRFATIARSLAQGEDYEVDEKRRQIALTDRGIEKAEKALGVGNIYTDAGVKYVHHLETAVRAKALFRRDKEYVVQGGQVVIVDEFTGRLQPGRRWSEGLHQAVEAKEGVALKEESRTFASITFQNYFRLYEKLGGMTGTAQTSSEEFYKVYGLTTVAVPTNRAPKRDDLDDLIFQTEKGKMRAIARRVKELHQKGQPVLVGTVSVENNELLSAHFAQEGIPHEVLNAKNHEREGEIIAQAGRKSAVTIATNMAGRGVDIKLGGNPATKEQEEEVRVLGGLAVIGTERHDARRIDNQLRGRSGRQGDPGSTQFFVSLEDNLMRIFAAETLKRVMGGFKIPEDEPIQNSLITRSLEKAQTRIEELNFDARKQVLAYDDVLNVQRKGVYERRRSLLVSGETSLDAEISRISEKVPDFQSEIAKTRKDIGNSFSSLARTTLLRIIDNLWVEHLESMEHLRSSVNLRAYGQRDPLVEYKREGLRLFQHMETLYVEEAARILRIIRPQGVLPEPMPISRSLGAQKGAENFGRNDRVVITDGSQKKEMKFKKAEPFLKSGAWKIVS
jgi:preprotein translocase subunit SecA